MSLLDYILLIIIGLSMSLSLWRGLSRELIAMIGLFASFFIASRFGMHLSDYLSDEIGAGNIANILGFVLTFFAVSLSFSLINALTQKVIEVSHLSILDRLLGLCFGALRGCLLISIFFLIYTSYGSEKQAWISHSSLSPYALNMADLLGKTIPARYPFSRQAGASSAPQMKDLIPEGSKESISQMLDRLTKE